MPTFVSRLSPARLTIYFLAFVLPSLSLGLLLLMVTASDLMIRPAQAPPKLAEPPALPRSPGPTAWIVAGNGGVQISELLIAYEILAESRAFQIELIGPRKVLSPTTADVSFMPTATWEEKAHAAPPALIVIPSVLDPGQSETVSALRRFGPRTGRRPPVVAVLSEGARLASEAGLMAGRRATSHFLALRDLRKGHPETTWVRDVRVVIDGGLITSSSVSAAPQAMLAALGAAGAEAPARAAAARLGYELPAPGGTTPSAAPFAEGTTPLEFARLILHGGYDFYKRETTVWLAPRAGESGLAAALDVMPRTFGAHVYTVAPARDWIVTQHGLPLVAGHALTPAPDRPVETLIIPPGAPAGEVSRIQPALAAWMAPYSPTTEDLRTVRAGEALDRMLAASGRLEGPTMTRYAAKMLGATYPESAPMDDPTWLLWLRPVLAGALGVWMVWTFRRWSRRLAAQAA